MLKRPYGRAQSEEYINIQKHLGHKQTHLQSPRTWQCIIQHATALLLTACDAEKTTQCWPNKECYLLTSHVYYKPVSKQSAFYRAQLIRGEKIIKTKN